ncbi:MAG: MG2 domain-containing protein, partial [Prevotellaceae bacterium]|nr:MG2 domain-containing protein [Prevotellaceae bacterium]
MRKRWKRYGLLLWLLCIMGLPLCAQSYDKQWEQVDEAREKGLSQTVIRLADNIYRKAEKEGNTAQLLKAYLCREKARQEVTPDSLYSHLAYMEQWVRRTANPIEKALLHTLLAGEYRDYLQNNRRALQARTEIEEETASADIRTWSAGLFIRQIDAHNKASLQDAEQLLQARAQAYVPLIEIEEGSLYYRHDLYHLVARRAIDLYQSIEGYAAAFPVGARIDSLYLAMLATYQAQAKAEEAQAMAGKAQAGTDKAQTKADKTQLHADSSQTGIDEAVLLTRLHYADWKRQAGNTILPTGGYAVTLQNSYTTDRQEGYTTVNSTNKDDLYLSELDSLIARYSHIDLIAEAYLRKATCLHSQGRTAEALRLCGEATARHAAYPHIQALENLRREMLRPTLSVRMEGTAYPGDSLSMRVQYRLLNGFSITLYATDLAETPQQEHAPTSNFLRRHARKLSTRHYALAPLPQAGVAQEDLPYQRADTTFLLSIPATPGTYLLRITPDDSHADSVDHLLAVTRLKVLTLALPDNQMEVVTLDARSGQPVEGATVSFHDKADKEERKTLLQVTTDSQGKALFTWINGIRCYTAAKGTDTALRPQSITRPTAGTRGTTPLRRLTLLTDRALYRPGQTIHVKGVAYVEAEDTVHVLASESYELQLLDANRKEVAKQTLVTNEFGSFSADFTLPAACLNGTFQLRAGTSGSTTVRVEAYKRPTFEIRFNPIEEAYRLGDTVRLTGTVTAYNGAPLQKLPLAYSVSRTAGLLWQGNPVPLLQDTVQINADGSFSLPVVLTPPAEYNPASGRSVNYRVTATVTEAAGETESTRYTLSATPEAYRFTTDLPAFCCKDSLLAATFQVRNADGRLLAVQGTCRLLSVDQETPVYEATFTSGKRQTFPEWSRLTSGMYRIQLSIKGADGEETGSDTDKPAEIYLFSLNDTRLAAPMTRFCPKNTLDFDAAHPAEIYYGTSCQDVYLLVDVFSKEKRLESRTLQLSDTLARMVYPYKEAYGEGVSVLLTFVKAGEVYSDLIQ